MSRIAKWLAAVVSAAVGPRNGGDPVAQPVSNFRSMLPWFLGGPSRLERLAEAHGVTTRLLRIGGRTRRYHVYLPDGLTRSRARIVVALQGGGGNALQFVHAIKAREMSRRFGFVIVAPQGAGWWRWSRRGSWNADSVARLGFAEVKRIDDIAFIRAVIRNVQTELGLPPAPTYVMGVSKGGMMAYRLTCALKEEIAAVAVVAGTMSTDQCGQGANVPLLHIHGEADRNVPLAGGRGAYSAKGSDWPAVAPGIDLFRRANGIDSEPALVHVTADTVCRRYSNGGEVRVEFCVVENGGHCWPGIPPLPRHRRRGEYVSQMFDATTYIAEFVLRH